MDGTEERFRGGAGTGGLARRRGSTDQHQAGRCQALLPVQHQHRVLGLGDRGVGWPRARFRGGGDGRLCGDADAAHAVSSVEGREPVMGGETCITTSKRGDEKRGLKKRGCGGERSVSAYGGSEQARGNWQHGSTFKHNACVLGGGGGGACVRCRRWPGWPSSWRWVWTTTSATNFSIWFPLQQYRR